MCRRTKHSRLTISYTNRETTGQDQCNNCLNTIYATADIIKNVIEPSRDKESEWKQ